MPPKRRSSTTLAAGAPDPGPASNTAHPCVEDRVTKVILEGADTTRLGAR
jgi:hypothetical protein